MYSSNTEARDLKIKNRANRLLRDHTVEQTKEIIAKEQGMKPGAIHSVIYKKITSRRERVKVRYNYPDLLDEFSVNVNPKY